MEYTDLSLRPPAGYAQWWILQGLTREQVDAKLQAHSEYRELTENERRECIEIASCGAKAAIRARQLRPMTHKEYRKRKDGK